MKKYTIEVSMADDKLLINVSRDHTVLPLIPSESYFLELMETDLCLKSLFLFGSLSSLYHYLSSSPQNIHFDNSSLQLQIKIPVFGSFKFMYLQMRPLQETKTNSYNKMEQQLLLRRGAMDLHMQTANSYANDLFYHYAEQIQFYTSQLRRIGNDCKREQTKIEELQRDIMKCTKKSLQLDEDIQASLKGAELEEYNLEEKEQYRQQKQKQVYFYQLGKLTHQKVSKLLSNSQPTSELQTLDLSQVELKSIRYVSMFSALKELNLSGNVISHMKGMEAMMNLQRLDLSTNRISRIEGLAQNKMLRMVLLHTNRIQKIENIFHLEKLEVLSLSNNMISSVPNCVDQLTALVELRLANNRVTQLPVELQNLKNLKVLSILGNHCFCERSQCRQVINRLVEQRGVQTIGSLF